MGTVQYKVDVNKRYVEPLMAEGGLKAPSKAGTIIARRTRAYGTGNIEWVISADKALQRLAAKDAAKKKRKNPCAKEIGEYTYYLNRSPDSPSGEEHAASS